MLVIAGDYRSKGSGTIGKFFLKVPPNVRHNPSNRLAQLRQQTVLASFGKLALTSGNLDEILTEACRLVGEGLGTDLAKVMKLQDDGENLLVRAGVGWKPGIVGALTLKVADSTSESLALKTGNPTVSPNIATETRFKYPQFLIDNGVEAMANVAIIGSGGRAPFGILQIDSRKPRRFTNHDTAFLSSYANLIAAAVDRLRVMKELRDALVEASKARDEADRANRAKSRFLSNMSHELRTPLNGILGYAQLLHLEGGLRATQLAKVDAMLSAGGHLLQMINRVLEISEIESEHIKLKPLRFDLRSCVNMSLDVVRPAAEAKSLELDLVAAPNVPRFVQMDPVRLRQVLINLLGNAVKFTEQGAIEVRLKLSPSGDRLRVEVADTGPGIPIEQHHRLFHDFERLATGGAEGAGLGLSISARLTRLMGGDLCQEENPQGGSIFWLELPIGASLCSELSPSSVSPVDAPGTLPDTTSARALRVLVVDDTAMNRDIAGSFLRSAGYEVAYAEGGAEAVEAIAAEDFDAILMDVRMPEMDGIEATRRVRLLSGARGQVPIVALTAMAFPEQVAACRSVGMNAHVTKPFTLTMLNDAIVHAIKEAPVGGDANSAISGVPSPVYAASRVDRISVSKPLIVAEGSELPILNRRIFESTAAFLARETATDYLRTIAKRTEEILLELRGSDASAAAENKLSVAAHSLAGSAALLGFERLAAVALSFERAIQTGKSETTIAADLTAAAEVTLEEIRALTVAHAVA